MELFKEKSLRAYKRIEDLLMEYNVPHRDVCLKILEDNRKLFETAPGSSHNHQAWPGGYIDHVHEVMNFAVVLYSAIKSTGRPMSFTLGQVLLVLFLHDLEKPWAYYLDVDGSLTRNPNILTKKDRQIFRDTKLIEYGIELTEKEGNAFRYVEGELSDYSPERRVMNEMAAICHACDNISARGFWDYPKAENDPWSGAQRFRTKQ